MNVGKIGITVVQHTCKIVRTSEKKERLIPGCSTHDGPFKPLLGLTWQKRSTSFCVIHQGGYARIPTASSKASTHAREKATRYYRVCSVSSPSLGRERHKTRIRKRSKSWRSLGITSLVMSRRRDPGDPRRHLPSGIAGRAENEGKPIMIVGLHFLS